ncbi:Pantoate-beta-alanine ligase [Trametes versicolor FP-101664 SS1]|uniref:Pantoate-beta-alanine ligase n=1 Tax=Trametes versicolor (strain FP-101664) TaxID=717944 RepID=UPI00046218DF|nr:Pantoate-beta-alanine ligase [Trametes versicolor FP-101664 SS1]EIW58567.1 Pantoate-beta-alanine ligase [Trametes versicolor FP-101664 SS1]
MSSALPPSSIPLFDTVASYREWRHKVRDEKKSVGYVATMGALHDGHLSLVKRSLAENDLTVLSIFVNPAQFAPHEDLATYPRTLPRDLELLSALSVPGHDGSARTPSAVFVPTVNEMYPSGISQNTQEQKGTFVEVMGYGHQMEGRTRPTFFRGVATVVTKLFNAIEPTRTYFGQKDIQQALLLRRMTRDLLLSHPDPEHLYIVPTTRDPTTSLALSSRNAYLSQHERDHVAPALYAALQAAQSSWEAGASKTECIQRAQAVIENKKREAGESVDLRLDYIEMNDAESFEVLADAVQREEWEAGFAGRPVILSGAMWVGKTRLIDNIVLGGRHTLGIVD